MSRIILPSAMNVGDFASSENTITLPAGKTIVISAADFVGNKTLEALAGQPPGFPAPTSFEKKQNNEIQQALASGQGANTGRSTPRGGAMGLLPADLHSKFDLKAGSVDFSSFNAATSGVVTMPGIVRASADDITKFATPMTQADQRALFDTLEQGLKAGPTETQNEIMKTISSNFRA